MTTANRWRDVKRQRGVITDLNRTISSLYAKCNGSHIPSEQRVTRDFAGDLRELRLCQNCGVPIATNHGWGSPAPAQRGGTRG